MDDFISEKLKQFDEKFIIPQNHWDKWSDYYKDYKKDIWGKYRDGESIKDFLSQALREQKTEIEKAYGGCRKCYGKGYASVWYGWKGSPDFSGDAGFVEAPKNNIDYCSCERGKQLQLLSQKEDGKEKE